MATVNKQSLREEFEALKTRFEPLCAEGKMSTESRTLVQALLMLFEVLMAVFLERHTPKSSANSSTSASQTPKVEMACRQKRIRCSPKRWVPSGTQRRTTVS